MILCLIIYFFYTSFLTVGALDKMLRGEKVADLITNVAALDFVIQSTHQGKTHRAELNTIRTLIST